ncbi:MAG: anaerobic carbon-monoxide dehydrogenase catalytic subunit [Deferribacterota bacterium]|nr:anaerobic carbon-monoxide dehydrogenase catalytic subunit [Deferribacterota bacterium]
MLDEKRSVDKAAREMLKIIDKNDYDNIWSRLEAQKPQCGYGELGVCCKNCSMGPCRINPYGDEPKYGVCGADADAIVARNLIRMIAAGASAHSDHGRKPSILLKEIAEGKISDYRIKEPNKLKEIAKKFNIYNKNDSYEKLAKKVAHIALDCYGRQDEDPMATVDSYMPKKRVEKLKNIEKAVEKNYGYKVGLLPRNIDRESIDILHRTHMGCDHDPLTLIIQGLRCALSDGWGGSLFATEFQDVLFGLPKNREIYANLGVLDESSVNIIVNGHEPILSEKVVEAAEKEDLIQYAKSKGASGINVVGMCCTGNELLERQGIPVAGNELHQELAITTGAVEAIVVDVQCIYPSLGKLSDCFHTKVISTSEQAHFPNCTHIQFYEDRANEIAEKIIRIAIDNYPHRIKEKIHIPKIKEKATVGFSVEGLLEILGGTPAPLVDAIKEGKILGIAAIVGCNNPKVTQDYFHINLTKKLLEKNILVTGTGCWAIALAKSGMMDMSYLDKLDVPLKEVCKTLNIPPVLHFGSCVDCSRLLVLSGSIADYLGVDTGMLPIVGSAPEWSTEKAVAIGSYFVATGIPVHLWPIPPIFGSPKVLNILTKDAKELIDGYFFVEPDVDKTASIMEEIILERRNALGLKTPNYVGG